MKKKLKFYFSLGAFLTIGSSLSIWTLTEITNFKTQFSNNISNFESSLDGKKKSVLENIDLATSPLASNTVYAPLSNNVAFNTSRKTLVDSTVAHKGVLEGQNVLSNDSINTVRSPNFFFNFINDSDRGNKINIVATPVNPNLNNMIVKETDFTSITDSAIYIGNSLLLVATENEKKFLLSYQIDDVIIEQQWTKELDEKDRLEVTSIFEGNIDNMLNKKYALSPYYQNFTGLNYSNVLLWPMGLTAKELANKPNDLFVEIKIGESGNIISNRKVISSFQNHPADGNLEIISLSVIETFNENAEFIDLSFIAFTSSQSTNNPIRIFQFGRNLPTGRFVGFNFIDEKSNPKAPFPGLLQRAELASIVPYAMPRVDEQGNVYLFWINQNGAERNNTDKFVPEALIKLKIEINKDGKVKEINQSNISNLIFREKTDEGNAYPEINTKSQIKQISYEYGATFANSAMATKNHFSFSPSDIHSTSVLPLKIDPVEFNDYIKVISEWHKSTITNSYNSTSGKNLDVVPTIYNSIISRAGYDYFETTTEELEPPVHISLNSSLSYASTYNTYLPNQIIYLPEKVQPDQNKPFGGRPVKVSEFDYTPLKPRPWVPPTENSVLWYPPHFLENISDYYYDFSKIPNPDEPYYKTGDFLTLTGETIFKDFNGVILDYTIDGSGKIVPPKDAFSVNFNVTVPFPFVNGSKILGQPFTVNFTFINNPGTPSPENLIVNLNNNFISGTASKAAAVLETFDNLKNIPQNQSVINVNDQALFKINPYYLNSAFQSINYSSDDFLGQLKVDFTFKDSNQRIYEQSFVISGFEADYILLPSILGPILAISLIVLIVVLVLNKKNKLNKKKSLKAGYILAKKIDKNHSFNVDNLKSKKANSNSSPQFPSNNLKNKAITNQTSQQQPQKNLKNDLSKEKPIK